MTKRFKKTRNFESRRILDSIEKELLSELEGDIYSSVGLDIKYDEKASDEDERNAAYSEA
jgi:hypothetical protein